MRRPGFVLVPQMWREELIAMKASGTVWSVAVELLRRARFSPVVKFSNEAAAKIGISRQAKWLALDRLRLRGLIAIGSRSGASPKVRVRYLD